MRRFVHSLVAVALVAAAIPFAGCSSDRIWRPASIESVDNLRADHDKALAQIRSDEQAARDAFKASFDAAIAQGRSTDEALGSAIAAESAKATGASTAAAQLAIDAKSRADAANHKGDGAVDWSTLLIGLLGTTGIGGVISHLVSKNKVLAQDALPFVGSDGRQVSEARIADLASATPIPKPA